MPETSNPRSWRRLGVTLVLLLAALAAGLTFAQGKGREERTPEVTPTSTTTSAALKRVETRRVETRKVCMINNQVFEKDQIPVEVEGRTYYGCCEMCKERLANDPAARTAVDPVSGKTVDKSEAVIAALQDGRVLYFESEETLAKYRG